MKDKTESTKEAGLFVVNPEAEMAQNTYEYFKSGEFGKDVGALKSLLRWQQRLYGTHLQASCR